MIKCEQPRLMAEIGHILKHGKTTKEADHSLFGKFTISSLSTKPDNQTYNFDQLDSDQSQRLLQLVNSYSNYLPVDLQGCLKDFSNADNLNKVVNSLLTNFLTAATVLLLPYFLPATLILTMTVTQD